MNIKTLKRPIVPEGYGVRISATPLPEKLDHIQWSIYKKSKYDFLTVFNLLRNGPRISFETEVTGSIEDFENAMQATVDEFLEEELVRIEKLKTARVIRNLARQSN